MTTGLAIGFVVGALVALVVTVLLREVRAGKHETAHAVALGGARSEVEQLKAELEGERRIAAERQVAWDEARNALKGEFASLSAAALRQSNEQFLQLANGRLELAQQAAKGDLDQRTQSIEQLLTPLREQLGRYEQGILQLGVRASACLCGAGPAGEAARRLPRSAPARDPQPRHGAAGAGDKGSMG